MATIKAGEKGKEPEKKNKETAEPEKPKVVVVWGLLRGGIIVASGYGFGAKRFSATELEQAVRCGVALEKQPIRAATRELSKFDDSNVFLSN